MLCLFAPRKEETFDVKTSNNNVHWLNLSSVHVTKYCVPDNTIFTIYELAGSLKNLKHSPLFV
jgi:hypothetical protein